MNRAFEILGLDADADIDERAIKRAYAAKLKTTRPDEDPEGFQRLHRAYQQALVWARAREEAPAHAHGVDDLPAHSSGDPMKTVEELLPALDSQLSSLETKIANAEALLARPDAALADDSDRFDIDAFLRQCTALAEHSRDGELSAWLHAQPVLWSLQHKAEIGHCLLQHLHMQRPPIPALRFDVLAGFFGLNDLHSGYDPYHIHMLRRRLQLAWEVKTRQLRLLAERTIRPGTRLTTALSQTDRILTQLTRPFGWPRALYFGLIPMLPSALRRFLYHLDFGRLDDLPPPIDSDQVAFWDAATDTARFSIPRLALGAARCVAYALLCVIAGGLLYLPSKGARSVADALEIVADAFDTFPLLLASMTTAWIAIMGGQALQQWQSLPDVEVARFRRLHHALIPGIATISMGLSLLARMEWAAILLGASALACAWHRYRARGGAWRDPLPRLGVWAVGPIILLIVVGAAVYEKEPRAVICAPAVLALSLWVADSLKFFRER